MFDQTNGIYSIGDISCNNNCLEFQIDDNNQTFFFRGGYVTFLGNPQDSVTVQIDNANPYNATILEVKNGQNNDTTALKIDAYGITTISKLQTISVTTGESPFEPVLGQFYFDTTLTKMIFWNGIVWAIINSIP